MLLQFLNQYFLVLLPAAVLAGCGVGLVLRRPRWGWWAAWAVLCLATGGGLLALRTPAATLTAFRAAGPAATLIAFRPAQPAEATPGDAGTELVAAGESLIRIDDTPQLNSVAEIRGFLADSGGKPTLVEFYTDYGLG
jgi:hypothetical protein